MRYVVIIEKGNDSYEAYVPDLPGCVAVGETPEEVRELIQEAILLHVESMRETGMAVPQPLSHSEYIDVPIAA
ncbi:MAG TPA: type II toxin-antitoxin system HicB family antitoxin [Roseiflexaceae bacterium]|jgi:predicted RNase H-like HicB family nuclease|nr:type II toxin-antitoxin system HicB family antitoxin [Roseiflexaceae bacterium]